MTNNLKCVICKKEIKDKFGHNAEPVKKGLCCSRCNYEIVIPTRVIEVNKNG